MSRPIVQSLWIGPKLSMMEQTSIWSFLQHGYDYHLYVFDNVAGVPEGVTLCDANEILSRDKIVLTKRGFCKGSPAGFSDMFRYCLLLKKGNWWVDTDVICQKPFDFDGDHVLGNELQMDGTATANVAVIKAPVGSSLMEYCYRACQDVDLERIEWGEIGPRLLERALHELNMLECIQSPSVFYPVNFWELGQLFDDRPVPEHAHAIHLWHARWKHTGIDPDGNFPPDCIWEKLRQEFLPGYAPPKLSPNEIAWLNSRLARLTTPRRRIFKRVRNHVRSVLGIHRKAA